MIWHNATAVDVLKELTVDDKNGLSIGEVDLRVEKYGENFVSKIERPTFLSRFLGQLKNKTVIVLIITALISFFVSMAYSEVDLYSPLLIIAIVVINALISAYQLVVCDNTIDDLKHITNPTVKTLRDGIIKSVNSVNLVPGDIIILEEGDYIPADARIIEANEFRCNEAVLTGVEIPVEKNPDLLFDDITSAEKRQNMIFSGTSVAHGSAKAVVVSTGVNTEIGKTSVIMQQTGDDKLPIENKLESLGKMINFAVLIVCVFVFAISLLQNFSAENFASMTVKTLMNSIALAIAVIPEGLPAITTIVIAIGMHRILKDKIILKDSSAAETLGKTNVICCDKTGVFTRNKMQLAKIYDGEKLYNLETDALNDKALLILKLATVCSTLYNDSTEDAIKNANLTYNSMSFADVDAHYPHITEIPFDTNRKIMTVVTMINEKPFAIVKGAPEAVIPLCNGCNKEELLKQNIELANDAYRNVCIAMKPLDTIPASPTAEDIECDLKFIGLLSLDDPPREGVVDDIATCEKAGIRTVMITGDNVNTAMAVARRIGILKDGTLAITGAELDKMTDDKLADNIDKYSVFARISPSDKIRIVKAWQTRRCIVTITGDSVEDADALALADVGCAIGRYGTDVAKGNADIIISNNRFSSIVNAIGESRGFFNNIKKSVKYLFSCNFAELLSFIVGILVFKNPPISAVQLLWINLLTDSAPAISLSMENGDKSNMYSKEMSTNRKFFNIRSFAPVLIEGIVMTVMTLLAYTIGNDFGDKTTAMTMAFVTLSLTQLFQCFNVKLTTSIFRKEVFSNKLMNVSNLVAAFIVLFLVFTPAGFLFGLTILSFKNFLFAFLLSLVIIPVSEIIKLILNRI